MEGSRILLVDDDDTVTEVLSAYLEKAGFQVDTAADGLEALDHAQERWPDLVVLDLMLPGIDGLDVCRKLRSIGPVPVVMLTALGAESDRVLGLEIGADDYVTKPFSPREVVLRVQSVLRRTTGAIPVTAAPDVLVDGDLRVDTRARTVTLDGRQLSLTLREFDLLVFFVSHAGQAFTREQLLAEVWGWTFGDLATVTVHVRRLREKIEITPSNPLRLLTVWSVGYRWDASPVACGDQPL